jgi:ERF superfamily
MKGHKMKVYEAINNVQGALAQVGIGKTRTNNQGSGYKFRGIDDVYQAIAPLLATKGLCILPRVLKRDCIERQSKSGGTLFYVTVEVEFDFVSVEDGSKHTVKTFGEAMDSGDKATNKAMSAAYKYACFQTFAIPIEGTPDADETTHEIASVDINVMADHLIAIQDAANEEELKKVYLAAYKACGTDKNWQKKMIQAKDDKKASF